MWEAVRWAHLIAMAFFVGGQLVLVAAVVPAFRGADDRTRLRAIARRFGWGSLVALAVLLATGAARRRVINRGARCAPGAAPCAACP